MDTRENRRCPEAARLAAEGATVVSGYFDPLLASHARRLAGLKRGAKLMVADRDPPQPILPARARAELVASLRVVDYVVEAGATASGADVRLEAGRRAAVRRTDARTYTRGNGERPKYRWTAHEFSSSGWARWAM